MSVYITRKRMIKSHRRYFPRSLRKITIGLKNTKKSTPWLFACIDECNASTRPHKERIVHLVTDPAAISQLMRHTVYRPLGIRAA